LTAGGLHIIVEFYGCTFSKLNDISFIKNTLIKAAHAAHCTVLHSYFHPFQPQGVTGFISLAESHISIHTWPEHGYAAIDIFACGEKAEPMLALFVLQDMLKPQNSSVKPLKRK
jgi:S-adenosylmethionine decarboxylase proenzyme